MWAGGGQPEIHQAERGRAAVVGHSLALSLYFRFDLVACTTEHPWRFVPGRAQEALQQNCRLYFQQTLSELPEGTILLSNGVAQKDISPNINFGEVEVEVKNFPPLRLWHGSLSHATKRFLLLGWRLLAKDITPNYDRMDALLKWLRGQIRQS